MHIDATYSFLLLLILGFGLLDSLIKSRKTYKIFLFIFLGIYCFLFSFRAISVGADYSSYVEIYNMFLNSSFSGKIDLIHSIFYMEKGYLLLNALFATLGLNMVTFQLFLCVVFSFCVYKFLCVEKDSAFVVLFFLYCIGAFFNVMNQTRAAIAVAICLYAITEMWNNKTKKSVILVCVACTIHTSAVIAFVVLFLIKIKKRFTYKNLLFSIVITGAMLVLFNPFLRIILILFPRYSGYFADDKIGTFIKSGNATYLIYFFCVLVFAEIQHRNVIMRNDEKLICIYNSLLWMCDLGLVISFLVLKLSMIQRVMTLPLFSSALLITLAIKMEPKVKNRIIYIFFIGICIIAYMGIYLYVSEAGQGRDLVVPYNFLW